MGVKGVAMDDDYGIYTYAARFERLRDDIRWDGVHLEVLA